MQRDAILSASNITGQRWLQKIVKNTHIKSDFDQFFNINLFTMNHLRSWHNIEDETHQENVMNSSCLTTHVMYDVTLNGILRYIINWRQHYCSRNLSLCSNESVGIGIHIN